MTKQLIFDMDGLLFDTEPMHYDAWKEVFQEFGQDLSELQFADFIGTSDWDVARWVNERFDTGLDVQGLINRKIIAFDDVMHRTKLLPGVKDFLDAASGKIPMCVASSTQKSVVDKMLRYAKIRDYFDEVTGGDEVEHRKPAPDIYLLAASRAGMNPTDCLAFEDSSPGVESASSAGMKVIAVPSELSNGKDFSKATKVVKNFNELDFDDIVKR